MFEVKDKNALLVKVPVNCGGLSKRGGLEEAPNSIIKEFDELFLSESFYNLNFDIKEIKVDNSNIDYTYKNIEENAVNILSDAKIKNIKALFLGGDHSITYSIFKAFTQVYLHKENNALVVFDAHPDLEDSKLSHEDYLRNLIKEGVVPPENVFVVGLRSVSNNELNFANKTKMNLFFMRDIFLGGVKEFALKLELLLKKFKNIYLSIDIDCIDPAFAPGTGYIEPAGLTSREFLYILNKIKGLDTSEQNKIKAIDIVEVNPKKDLNHLTTKLAAKILFESI